MLKQVPTPLKDAAPDALKKLFCLALAGKETDAEANANKKEGFVARIAFAELTTEKFLDNVDLEPEPEVDEDNVIANGVKWV